MGLVRRKASVGSDTAAAKQARRRQLTDETQPADDAANEIMTDTTTADPSLGDDGFEELAPGTNLANLMWGNPTLTTAAAAALSEEEEEENNNNNNNDLDGLLQVEDQGVDFSAPLVADDPIIIDDEQLVDDPSSIVEMGEAATAEDAEEEEATMLSVNKRDTSDKKDTDDDGLFKVEDADDIDDDDDDNVLGDSETEDVLEELLGDALDDEGVQDGAADVVTDDDTAGVVVEEDNNINDTDNNLPEGAAGEEYIVNDDAGAGGAEGLGEDVDGGDGEPVEPIPPPEAAPGVDTLVVQDEGNESVPAPAPTAITTEITAPTVDGVPIPSPTAPTPPAPNAAPADYVPTEDNWPDEAPAKPTAGWTDKLNAPTVPIPVQEWPVVYPSPTPPHDTPTKTQKIETGSTENGTWDCTTRDTWIGKTSCQIMGSWYHHPLAWATVCMVLYGIHLFRKRRQRASDLAARGAYRQVAARFAETAFDDHYSVVGDDDGGGDDDNNGQGWINNRGKGSIQMKNFGRDGLGLDEVNG